MRILRLTCGKTKKDKIWNEHIYKTTEVDPVEDLDTSYVDQ